MDKNLVIRLNAGDYLAFSNIFITYYKDLVLFAGRFISDQNDAEEIVQDIFVKLWEDRKSIKIQVSLKSYLLRTVHNKCIDLLRHKKVMRIHNDYMTENSSRFEYDTDNYILFSELNEQIEIALEKLPEIIAEPFRMNRYKGLKYHEIALILKVSERTVEVRIGKALSLLREFLKDYFMIILFLLNLPL